MILRYRLAAARVLIQVKPGARRCRKVKNLRRTATPSVVCVDIFRRFSPRLQAGCRCFRWS